MKAIPVTRETRLRAAAVVAITGAIAVAAACSSEDTVDTVPPPWPTRTSTPDGPMVQIPTPTQVPIDPTDLPTLTGIFEGDGE